MRLEGLAFGGDYNPEQWPEECWAEDARLMREAGVNLVSLPVFAWPLLEPEPGRFDFAWLDRVIDTLWSAGVRVDLATATATPPAWLVREHPGVLPVTADGVRLEFGSRQAHCPSSPVFKDHALRLTEAMAGRYGGHEAVVLWHISNEYGDHVARCYCDVSAAHFRSWLQDRYGTVEALNNSWGTSCWGQHYRQWSHVEPPRAATGPVNPSQRLDFERFSSHALLELFRAEVEVLRRITPNVPVTTNFMGLFRQLDYWDFAAIEDLVTDDAYPDPADPLAHVGAALNYGLMRSLKGGKPWLLLEQAASAVSWREVNIPRPPGQMRLLSLQALAHGSDGVLFFQWRAARFGPEKFHSAMLGQRGTSSRSYQECSALGGELARLSEVKGSRVLARVALVVDWDAWWGLDAPDSLPSQRLDWLTQARAWHSALFALAETVDVVRTSGPFDGYHVVVAPNLYLLGQQEAEALRTFVAAGGHLVVGPFSGVVDTNDTVHLGGAPGPLRDLLGVEVDEWWPLPDGQTGGVDLGGEVVGFSSWSEWLAVTGAEIIGRYADGDLSGRAAVTLRTLGAGAATYVSAGLGPHGLGRVLGDVCRQAGLPVATSPGTDLETVTRRGDSADYTFVLNHGTCEVEADLPDGVDLLTDTPVAGPARLPARGALVVRHPRTPHHPDKPEMT